MWSSASHWVLGVPYDMIVKARRARGEDAELAVAEMETLVHINVRRLLYIGRASGLWLAGLTCFMLTGLGLLAFVYWVEFAQAVFLMSFRATSRAMRPVWRPPAMPCDSLRLICLWWNFRAGIVCPMTASRPMQISLRSGWRRWPGLQRGCPRGLCF